MSIVYINPNLPPSEKIERLNRQTLELNGSESEGQFDKHEADNIYEQLCIGRKFKRRVNIGSTISTYTNWTHYSEQTGYSIWKCVVEDFADNTLNELYFSDDGTPVGNIGALAEYIGEALVETDVPALLSMTSNEILARSWKWCYYGGYIYLTIRNSGNANYEGDYYITEQSTDTLKRDFFIYNHQIIANYEDSTYEYNYICAANELYVTDAGEVDGYGNPYVSYTSGRVLIYGTIYDIESGEILVELGTINYIFVNSSGVVTSNTTGWPATCVPMAIVVCDETGILSIVDKRSSLNTIISSADNQAPNVTTVNVATYDLLVTDYILDVTYTATGAVTSLTLLSAQATDGRIVIIKDAGGNAAANNITVDTEGTETIDGQNTLVINADYDSVSLYARNGNWFVF